MEDLGCFYGDYRIPPIEMNRLNSITHGTRNPTREELEIIAETLEVSVNWLLYGGEYPELNWDDPDLFRPTLLQFRKSHGLTQKALAAEMDVSPSKIRTVQTIFLYQTAYHYKSNSFYLTGRGNS